MRRLLDPWAGLLYAALIVLAVVILSAMPAPWRAVGGEAPPVTLADAPPSDLAVFVLAGPDAARCTAVVWLHVEHDPARMTAVLVPASTLCAVPGGGFAPISRLVTDVDPATAAGALGDAVGVEPAGWVTLDRLALMRLFALGRQEGAGREGSLAVKTAVAAFSAPAGDVAALRRQSQGLARGLRAVPYEDLSANALVNYALGSAEVETDLDLRAASTLAATLGALTARDVAVGVAPAIVERAAGPLVDPRRGPSRAVAPLVRAGPHAPRPGRRPSRRACARRRCSSCRRPVSRVAFSLAAYGPPSWPAGALPVEVRSVSLGGNDAAARLAVLLARRRPLAVVLVPGPSGDETEAVVAGRLTAMTEVVRVARQPAVVALGPARDDDETTAAAMEGGLPVVAVADPSASPATAGTPAPGALPTDGEARRAAARLVAATVSRACWPAYLAPSLPGTRLEFSYAARRATTIAVAEGNAAELTQRLSACGWEIVVSQDEWASPPAPAVVHLTEARRAALTLAGDLGWTRATLVADPSAPADLVVVACPTDGATKRGALTGAP